MGYVYYTTIALSWIIIFSLSSSFQYNRLKHSFGRVLHRLATVTPTEDTIDPASYTKDLYKVLGVLPNASRTELRDAYWSIASQNHPDRNKSQPALEIFRNASYAYKILGKDPKLRREYDSSLQTKQFVEVMREVGSEIVYPLTMDVAVPLINMTFKSIGAVAIPFFRDAFEQSSAIFSAATKEIETGDDESGFDYISKAAQNAVQARQYVGAKQNVRRAQEQLDKIADDLMKTSRLLEDAKVKEIDAMAIKLKQLNASSAIDTQLQNVTRDVSQFTGAYLQARDDELAAGGVYRMIVEEMRKLINKSTVINSSIESTKIEIENLEKALAAAKLKLDSLSTEYVLTINQIEPEKSVVE
eukprot:gene1602-3094_t